MTLTNGQQAALYFARKQRRMRAAKITAGGDLSADSGTAQDGDVVGTLKMVPTFGAYTFELTDDGDGAFVLDGADITVADHTLLSAGTATLAVKATDSSGNVFTLSVPVTIT